MKLKKNLAAAVLAAAMVASLTTPVFAADNEDGTKSTLLTYNVAQEYLWSIPSDVTFSEEQNASGATGTIEGTYEKADENAVVVTKNVIGIGKTLKITVEGDGENNAFTIKTSGANAKVLNYAITLKKADDELQYGELGTDKVVLSIPAGTNSGEQILKFTLTTKATDNNNTTNPAVIAGNYTGNAVFTATVE